MRLGYAWAQQTGSKGAEEALAVERAGCDRIVVESSAVPAGQNPVLNAMLAHLEGNDTLVVWRLDRLANSTSALIELIGQLSARGISVQSISENLSISEEHAVSKLLEVLVEFDRSRRRERSAFALAERKIGRPRTLAREDIERARALVQEGGRSVVGLAHELGVSRSTLYRYLREAV